MTAGWRYLFFEKVCPCCGSETTEDDQSAQEQGLTDEAEWCPNCGVLGDVRIRYVYLTPQGEYATLMKDEPPYPREG